MQNRDHAGDQRDNAGHQRDLAGDQRDLAADERDQAGDQRDQAGYQRDHVADERDQAADERDQAADQRALAADQSEATGAPTTTGTLRPLAQARREAASDRRHSSADRGAGASERSQAEVDRRTSAADRGACSSDRSQAELAAEALRRDMEEADRASQSKSDFLATMSHEIRTPLNAVIGMTGLLLETELDAVQRDYAETARSSGESLLAVINDILDFSKIEAGRIELEEIDFNLRTAVEETMGLVAACAHSRDLELAALIDPDVPLGVRGDPGRFRQVLINLLSNAVKFTAAGEVTVRVALVGADGDSVDVRVEVSDTGIGIDAAEGERLFESFSQADSSTTRRYGGTGLGLAISKQLVELLGGTIGVHSDAGCGSTFWFTARLGHAHLPVPRPPPVPDDLVGLRVLVVDDNATNRMVLDQMLRSWRMCPTCVGDGPSALEAMRGAAAAGQPFPIAVVDHHMPGMDGPRLVQAIRSDDGIRATRLVFLTSSRRRGDAGLAPDANVDASLTKPVSASSLFSCLAGLMGSGDGPADALRPRMATANGTGSRARVLVVEDNVANQKVAARTLETMGYHVDVAANGIEAIDALARIPYGAILMDCQMPEMDGYEATGEIRRREGDGPPTPIIAMTAGVTRDEQARCLRAGMDDYLAKPVRPVELDRVLQGWIRDGATPAATREETSAGVLDPAALRALKDLQEHDPAQVASIVGLFLNETQAQLDTLRELPADSAAVIRTLHSLKGSCATFAATEMASLCGELEDSGAMVDPQFVEALARLDEHYEAVAGALRSSFPPSNPNP